MFPGMLHSCSGRPAVNLLPLSFEFEDKKVTFYRRDLCTFVLTYMYGCEDKFDQAGE
jgi:hypothetical protein